MWYYFIMYIQGAAFASGSAFLGWLSHLICNARTDKVMDINFFPEQHLPYTGTCAPSSALHILILFSALDPQNNIDLKVSLEEIFVLQPTKMASFCVNFGCLSI